MNGFGFRLGKCFNHTATFTHVTLMEMHANQSSYACGVAYHVTFIHTRLALFMTFMTGGLVSLYAEEISGWELCRRCCAPQVRPPGVLSGRDNADIEVLWAGNWGCREKQRTAGYYVPSRLIFPPSLFWAYESPKTRK